MELSVEGFNMGRLKFTMILNNLLSLTNIHQLITARKRSLRRLCWCQKYLWISVPLTHHCKKCTVMWMIMELIGENPLISVTSLCNLEMSQRSSDVPILVNFSIYISLISSLNWAVSFKIYVSPLSTMLFPTSETFKKSQLSEFFDVSSGCCDKTEALPTELTWLSYKQFFPCPGLGSDRCECAIRRHCLHFIIWTYVMQTLWRTTLTK